MLVPVWKIKSVDESLVKQVSEEYSVPQSIAQIMVQRNLISRETTRSFFKPDFNNLHDPFLMKDMDKAVDRILHQIEKKGKILIMGDYDVDGTTATSLLVLFFRSIDVEAQFYIPSRENEGYGVSMFGIDYAEKIGANLIITCDCGITAVKQVNYAKDKGIDTLDTAAGYGNSEQVLGEIGVNDYQVVTKTTSFKNGVDEVIKGFHQSLNDLNIGQVDGLLIHDINEVKDKEFNDLFKQLNELKRQGLANKIGFSTYTPEQVDFLLENFDFDLIQVPFNVFDTRLVQGGQLQALVHARSVFLQGVLLSLNNLSNYFSTWGAEFGTYQELVKDSGLSLLEYSINFALNMKEIDKVLVGVNSKRQLMEITAAIKEVGNIKAHPINDINLLNPSLWKL